MASSLFFRYFYSGEYHFVRAEVASFRSEHAAKPRRRRILQRTLGWATPTHRISLRGSPSSSFAHPLSHCGNGIRLPYVRI